MAACPRVRDAFKEANEAQKPYDLQLESQPVVPFPLIDLRSYYTDIASAFQ